MNRKKWVKEIMGSWYSVCLPEISKLPIITMYYFYNERNHVQIINEEEDYCSHLGLGDNGDLGLYGGRGDW